MRKTVRSAALFAALCLLFACLVSCSCMRLSRSQTTQTTDTDAATTVAPPTQTSPETTDPGPTETGEPAPITFYASLQTIDLPANSVVLTDALNYDPADTGELIPAQAVSELRSFMPRATIQPIFGADIPAMIDRIDGEHNGENYVAYSFYLYNGSETSVVYDYVVSCVDATRGIDKAIRVRVYEDGTPTTYAALGSDGKEEYGTEPFIDNETVTRAVNGLEPRDYVRFTVVAWIEYEDANTTDDVIGGEFAIRMEFCAAEDTTEEQTDYSFSADIDGNTSPRYSVVLTDSLIEDPDTNKMVPAKTCDFCRNTVPCTEIRDMDGADLPSMIDNVDGEHNGENYIAYTFYLYNGGDSAVNYVFDLVCVSPTNDIDKAIRVRLYQNGEPTTYAAPKTDGTGAEVGTVPFLNGLLIKKGHASLDGGKTDKFTVVIWIEGNDPDTTDAIIGGQFKIRMTFGGFAGE